MSAPWEREGVSGEKWTGGGSLALGEHPFQCGLWKREECS